jgi:hypothetical protein
VIEGQRHLGGMISRSTSDERGTQVLGGRVREDDDGSLYIDWVVNPGVRRLSAAQATEVLEVVRDLRENLWTLERLREQRRGAR